MGGTDPETELEVTTPESVWSQIGTELVWAPIDSVHGNKFTFDAGALLIVTNNGGTGGTDPHTFQVLSQPDTQTGRYGDIDIDIAAGEFRIFHFQARGWKDDVGYVVIPAGQSEELMVAIVAVAS